MQLIKQDIKYENEPTAKLTGYISDNSVEIDAERVRPVVLICPGGAYRLTSDREAEPIALQFIANGCQAFVLRYSVKPVCYPVALHQLAKSVVLIRENASRWHIDPNKIIVAGFSAGGHLAASLGVFWNTAELADMGYTSDQIKPNGLLLGYPVITAGVYAHKESFVNLLGSEQQNMAKFSLENQVTEAIPRTFIWHTVADATVPVENSLLFATALQKANVPFELHLFPNGRHGLSLATPEVSPDNSFNEPEAAVWFDLFVTWLKQIY